jgi:16S rRNA processing protein RimM
MAAKDSGGHPPEDLVVGRIIRPHGIRGMLLVEPFTEVIRSLKPTSEILLGSDKVPVVVREFRPHRARFLLVIDGCEDRDAAERWRGDDIFVRFDDVDPLPDGVYYHWQILGLEVATEGGEVLGTVERILETGANDVYVVRSDSGEELLLPAIESVILEVDLQEARITVHLIPGLRADES